MLLCVILSVELCFTICPRVLPPRFVCFFFFSIVFSACYHWWICFFGLVALFFLSFFVTFKFFLFLIIIFYFNNYFILFYFILFYYILSFFLPFLLSCVEERVLVLWPGVRPMPLRWESRVQDIGPPETSRLHVISNGESSPRDLNLNEIGRAHV